MRTRNVLLLVLGIAGWSPAPAQVSYPYTSRSIRLVLEGQPARMSYMNAAAPTPNGRTVVLLHGKNFNGYYWGEVIAQLNTAGFRVVVPDQVGWGKSDKPHIHYSFHQLAANTKALLDSLGVGKVSVIGHSMGGTLATRFALLYPERVEKLVLENPIGLEDYRTFVPYTSVDSLYAEELRATEASYRKYQRSYYPEWNEAYEPLVQAQAAALHEPDFPRTAWANALTYQMIYEQPICYEFGQLACPTLLVIGQADRTIVGKARIPEREQAVHGQYPELGQRTQRLIAGARLVELPGVGHIPHVQEPAAFAKAVVGFLTEP